MTTHNDHGEQDSAAPPVTRFQKICNVLMASCLGVMAVAVFINVLLRYGFGSGIAASEELSRLLIVWMVAVAGTRVSAQLSTVVNIEIEKPPFEYSHTVDDRKF